MTSAKFLSLKNILQGEGEWQREELQWILLYFNAMSKM